MSEANRALRPFNADGQANRDQAAEPQDRVESGEHLGKIVLEIGQ